MSQAQTGAVEYLASPSRAYKGLQLEQQDEMLPISLVREYQERIARATYHAGAREHVPTQPDAISVLHLSPLLLQ